MSGVDNGGNAGATNQEEEKKPMDQGAHINLKVKGQGLVCHKSVKWKETATHRLEIWQEGWKHLWKLEIAWKYFLAVSVFQRCKTLTEIGVFGSGPWHSSSTSYASR